jgi:hypothetical protein
MLVQLVVEKDTMRPSAGPYTLCELFSTRTIHLWQQRQQARTGLHPRYCMAHHFDSATSKQCLKHYEPSKKTALKYIILSDICSRSRIPAITSRMAKTQVLHVLPLLA